MDSYIGEQSIGVNGGLSSYTPHPHPHAPASPRPARRPPPTPPHLTHTQSPPYRYRGQMQKKNAAGGGIEPPSVFYPDIRTYLTVLPYLYVRYGMFLAELKSSFPHSQKEVKQDLPQSDRQTDRQRLEEAKVPGLLISYDIRE